MKNNTFLRKKSRKISPQMVYRNIFLLLSIITITSFSMNLASAGTNLTSNTFYCYQESANVSTGCGGLNTGKYKIGDEGWFGVETWTNAIDGNWDSNWLPIFADLYYHVNYTIPNNTIITNSLLQVRESSGTIRNLTILNNCSTNDNTIELKAYNINADKQGVVYFCKNISNNVWNNLSYPTGTDGYRFYEEAIIWSTYSLYENSQTYNAVAYESKNESFYINFSYDTSYTLSNVYLNYNGTNYLASSTGTGNTLSNAIISIPSVAVSGTNLSFYWTIGLANSTGTYYFNSTINNQTINYGIPLSISANCPVGTSPALNFTSFYESNRTKVNFTSVKYIVQYGYGGNPTSYSINSSLSNVNSFAICINNSQDYYNIGYGEIQYQVTGTPDRRYYVFSNTRITNQTINIPIYSLDSTSTSFLVTAQDSSLNVYKGYYIGLLRWYPEINSYQVVELGKTDDNGQTVLHVKTEDVDYRLALYAPDGTLIKLLSSIRMVCQTTPCVYSLIVSNQVDLTTFLNIQSELTFNPTTKVFTYTFNDISQDTTSMNLTVWQDFADKDSVIICNSVSNSYTGVLICDVSAYTGQLRAEVYRSASPPILITQLLADVRQTLIDAPNGGTIVLFLGLILVVTFALMGTMSPVLVIILSLIALIPLVFLGGLSYSIFILIGVIAGIVLHFLRRVS